MDSNDPRMMILDADPAKYIRTPSGAVVVMIKAAEGYAAYFLGLRMLELVKAVFPICSFMPIEILSLLVPNHNHRLSRWFVLRLQGATTSQRLKAHRKVCQPHILFYKS